MTGVPGWFCSDTDVAPRLIRQLCESMMSPLVTGWLIGCRNFDRNWWFHFFSSHQLTLPRQKVGDQELPPAGSSSTGASNIGTTAWHCRTKRPPRRVVSSTVAPSNRCRICFPAWMNVSMPLSINRETLRIGRFTSSSVKATRSSSP